MTARQQDDDADARRRRFRDHFAQCARLDREHEAATAAWVRHMNARLRSKGDWTPAPPQPAAPVYPPFPEDLRGLTCGARTRARTPCKRLDTWGNGRCPLHGGKSTGPTTEAGRSRSAENLRLGRMRRGDAAADRPGQATAGKPSSG